MSSLGVDCMFNIDACHPGKMAPFKQANQSYLMVWCHKWKMIL